MPSPPTPQHSAAALDAAVDAALRTYARLDEDTSRVPLREGGWCARETLGHLVDSACNNHRRFVIGQPPGVSRFEGYAQDDWVGRQRYRDVPWADVVALWTAYNRHLAHVMRVTSPEDGLGSALAPNGRDTVTVAFLMDDYVRHLEHHVGQIASFATSLPRRWPVGQGVSGGTAQTPPHRTLRGVRHDFVPIDPEAHAADLFGSTNGPDAAGHWTYLWYGPFADEASMRAWLQTCADSTDTLFFAVVEHATGQAVGMCSLLRIAPEMRTVELGHIWYAPSVQGASVNADMALTFLSACFEEWGYRRVEWKCDSLNTRSRGAALKLGFTFEGIFRQHMVRKGRNRDTAWYAMVDSEWPQRKAALQRLVNR